ncbi:recombinase family protein, partial [Enterobacter hormaechei]
MLIGYARVSRDKQETALQLDALDKAGCQRVYVEKLSGASTERPELERCLDTLREGDTLIVWHLDRLGRSIKDLIEIVSSLKRQGIGFRSLTQSDIDTT